MIVIALVGKAQGDQTIITVPTNAAGTTFQAILHLPNDYATTTTKYPLIMFFQGAGQAGPNPISVIYNSPTSGGPAYVIAQGQFPTSFVNPKDGLSYKFIVVSPQANPPGAQMSTPAIALDFILTYLYKTYRVDTSRVYLTGLSDGGQTVVEYLGREYSNSQKISVSHQIAAAAPMSENGSAGNEQEQADSIIANKVGCWLFGSSDTQGQNTINIKWWGDKILPNWFLTTTYTGGHCCWNQFYDPKFTQNGMNLYQWFLTYQSPTGVVPPPPPPPVLPTPLASYSDSLSSAVTSDSLVLNAAYTNASWHIQHGPGVIGDTTKNSTIVTGLQAGKTTVISISCQNAGNTYVCVKVITVAPVVISCPVCPICPVIPPGNLRVKGISMNALNQFVLLYWDGIIGTF